MKGIKFYEDVIRPAFNELVDMFIKTKKSIEERDIKNAEERKRIEHRKYWLECKFCGSKDMRFSRVIDKEEETWDDVENYNYYCHDGFGWELDRFNITCAKCGGDKIEVAYKNIKENKSR